MHDQKPQVLQYASARRPAEFLIRPRYRLAAVLVVGSIVGSIVAVAYIAGRPTFLGISRYTAFIILHVGAVVMMAAAHLLSRWPENAGVEPVGVALTRWFAQGSLRVLVLLSLAYLAPMYLAPRAVAATAACVGVMLAHDALIVVERYRRGQVL